MAINYMKIFNIEQTNEIIQLYNNELSADNIGAKFNCSRSTIYKILRKNNIRIRSTADWSTKYYFNQDFLKNIDTPEKAYFLGFFCSDGSFLKGSNGISFHIGVRDIDILEKFKILLESDLPIKIRRASGSGVQDTATLLIVGGQFYKNIKKLEIAERKTQDLKFPTFIKKDLMPHFIRGYFDGDGWITIVKRKNRNNKIEPTVGIVSTKDLINGIGKWCDENNIKYIKFFKQVKSMELWTIQITGAYQVLRFLDIIYDSKETLFLQRKMDKFISLIQTCLGFNENVSSGKRYVLENDLVKRYC